MSTVLIDSFPPIIQAEQVKSEYINELNQLIQAFQGGNLSQLPTLSRDVLSALVLIPQAAATLKNCTGMISDVVWWAWATRVAETLDQIRDCICEIAAGGVIPRLRVLKVTVDAYPQNTDVIPGQGIGPNVLFPVGWVNFVTQQGSVERQFINHPVQLFPVWEISIPYSYQLWKKPGVQMSATWIQ